MNLILPRTLALIKAKESSWQIQRDVDEGRDLRMFKCRDEREPVWVREKSKL